MYYLQLGTIERALSSTVGVLKADISLVMNTAVVNIDGAMTSPNKIVEIIEELGFDANIIDLQRDKISHNLNFDGTALPQSEESLSEVKYFHRKVMLQVEEDEFHLLTAENVEIVLQSLRNQSGVMECSYSGILTGSDLTQFKVMVDENLVGPRTLVYLLERLLNLHVKVVSLGGFMMAERMLKMQRKEQRTQLCRLVLALAWTIPLLIIAMVLPMYSSAKVWLDTVVYKGLNIYGMVLFILASAVQWWSGYAFHKKALYSLRSGALGMDFLISSGTIAAYTFSLVGLLQGLITGVSRNEDVEFFEVAAVLIAVVILGKYLECFAKGRTAAAIHRLTSLRATRARLVRSNPDSMDGCNTNTSAADAYGCNDDVDTSDGVSGDRLIDASLLQRGDVVRLVEGESLPSDGILLTNSVGVDESMLTGESRLVSKNVGDALYGGSLVMEGSAEMTVTACGDNSTLGRIVSSVQAAQGSKPPIQEIADRISFYFVPTVALISAVTFIVWSVAGASGAVPSGWFTEKNPNGNYILFAFVFSLAVWVSACPCAFGLATPTAILVATGVAAKHGILVRRGAALQYAAEVQTVVFDKTGTLTMGQTTVCDFIVQPDKVYAGAMGCASQNNSTRQLNEEEIPSLSDDPLSHGQDDELSLERILKLLLAAESSSGHPLAKGIAKYCTAALSEMMKDPVEGSCDDNKEDNNWSYHTLIVPGQGIKLTVSPGKEMDHSDANMTDSTANKERELIVLVGSHSLHTAHGVIISRHQSDTALALRVQGKVALFMSVGNVLKVIIGVNDDVRPDAASVVAALQSKGVDCYMVTGDQRATAIAIGDMVGIPSEMVFAGAKPDEKEKFIHALQKAGNTVAFIGDGTNDSPALARADVGFAMAGGTDIAIEAGDIVLCRNDLTSMMTAIHLAAKTMQRIKLNYFWALSYNCILIPISAGVFFPSFHFTLIPMLAAAAMALSSVCIVISSLLLLFYSPPQLKKVVITPDVMTGGEPHEFSSEGQDNSAAIKILECICPATRTTFQLNDEHYSLLSPMRLYHTIKSTIARSDKKEVQNLENCQKSRAGLYGIAGPYTAAEALVDVIPEANSSTDVIDTGINQNAENETTDVENFLQFVTEHLKVKEMKLLNRRGRRVIAPHNAPNEKKSNCPCRTDECRCGSECRCGTRR